MCILYMILKGEKDKCMIILLFQFDSHVCMHWELVKDQSAQTYRDAWRVLDGGSREPLLMGGSTFSVIVKSRRPIPSFMST